MFLCVIQYLAGSDPDVTLCRTMKEESLISAQNVPVSSAISLLDGLQQPLIGITVVVFLRPGGIKKEEASVVPDHLI